VILLTWEILTEDRQLAGCKSKLGSLRYDTGVPTTALQNLMCSTSMNKLKELYVHVLDVRFTHTYTV
jgi:hypothetical protein